MRKLSLFIVLCLCLTFMCACSDKSDAKLFVTQGDTALNNRSYESALEYYEKAKKSGSDSDKVIALCEILRAYIDAENACENNDYKKAARIIDELEYDYNAYSPIDDDMRDLIHEINLFSDNDNRIDIALDKLAEAIAESDFDRAYELINELDGYDLSTEQQNEFEYQIERMARKQANLGITKPNSEKTEKTEEEKQPEKSSESEKEDTPKPAPDNSADSSVPSPEKSEETSDNDTTTKDTWYRVRKSWEDASSQLGAFRSLENAIKEAKANPGYKVFDENGKVVYP